MVQHSGRGRRSSWPVPLHLEVDRDPAWPPRVSSLAWVRGCGPLKWRLEAGMPGRAKSSEPREGVLSPFPHAHACSMLSPRQSPPSSSPHLFPRRPSGGASRREGNAAPGCPLPFWGCIHCLASDKALKSRRGSGFTWESPYPKVRHGFGDWESTAQGWPTDFRGQESRQYVGSGVGLGPVPSGHQDFTPAFQPNRWWCCSLPQIPKVAGKTQFARHFTYLPAPPPLFPELHAGGRSPKTGPV